MASRKHVYSLVIVAALAWLSAGTAIGQDDKAKEQVQPKPKTLELETTLKTNDGPAPRHCFSPQGKHFATASPSGEDGVDGVAKLWDAKAQTVIWQWKLSPWDAAIKISPDGQQVLAGRSLLDLKGDVIQTIENKGPIKDAVFSRSGRLILVSSVQDKKRGEFGDAVFVWETKTGTRIKALEPGDRNRPANMRFWWPAIAWSADGKYIATCISEDNGKADLTLWDAETFALLARVPAHANRVYTVEFSPSGKMLATAGMDQTIKIWKIDESAPRKAKAEVVDRLVKELDHDDFQKREDAQRELEALGQSVESRLRSVIKDTESAEVRSRAEAILKRLASGKVGLWRTLEGNPRYMQKLVFHPDGEHIIASSQSSDGTNLLVWSMLEPLQPVFAHQEASGLMHLDLSPDGKTLATSHIDGSVKRWQIKPK